VVSALAHSTDVLSRVVNGVYVRFLNRNADPGGLAGWVTAMQQGMTEEQVSTSSPGGSVSRILAKRL
jgi:hypothetical protein